MVCGIISYLGLSTSLSEKIIFVVDKGRLELPTLDARSPWTEVLRGCIDWTSGKRCVHSRMTSKPRCRLDADDLGNNTQSSLQYTPHMLCARSPHVNSDDCGSLNAPPSRSCGIPSILVIICNEH